jgi:hypothetical protein
MHLKIKFLLRIICVFGFQYGMAQVGMLTNNPDRSAALDLNAADKGILIPRVSLTSTTIANPIITPATGLLVYNTATIADVTPNFYYWDNAKWNPMGAKGPQGLQGPSAKIPTYVVALGTGVDLLSTTTTYTYTGTSFTLPPGRWIVKTIMTISKSVLLATNLNECWWIESTFTDSPTSGTVSSADMLNSKQNSGALYGNSTFGILNGLVTIENNTGADKTYYYMAKVANSINGTGQINKFGGNSGNGNNIVIQKY